jgi:ribosomal protein L40E
MLLAISALEKQIPQKPEMIWDTTFGKIRPYCLACGASNPAGANYC